MSSPLTCEEVIQFIMQYLDGELPSDVHAAFEAHLVRCAACIAYIDSYEKTVALGKTAFPDHYDSSGESLEEVPEALVTAILWAARTPPPTR